MLSSLGHASYHRIQSLFGLVVNKLNSTPAICSSSLTVAAFRPQCLLNLQGSLP